MVHACLGAPEQMASPGRVRGGFLNQQVIIISACPTPKRATRFFCPAPSPTCSLVTGSLLNRLALWLLPELHFSMLLQTLNLSLQKGFLFGS